MENWKNVLEKFLKEYKEKDYVIGAILCGSYATGNNTDRLEIVKYCKFCKKHTTHKETK